MGGGVSTLAQMVWGTYFEKNCPCSKGHLLGLGGLNPCQDGLGHLCSENWSSNGICSSRPGNRVPQRARLSEGGGVKSYLGNAQIDPTFFKLGLPLGALYVTTKGPRHLSTICYYFAPISTVSQQTLSITQYNNFWATQNCMFAIVNTKEISFLHLSQIPPL